MIKIHGEAWIPWVSLLVFVGHCGGGGVKDDVVLHC